MAGRDPVGVICRRSDAVSGDEDGPEFIQCVDGRKPKIHKVWIFCEDGVIPEVHQTAQVDVDAGFVS